MRIDTDKDLDELFSLARTAGETAKCDEFFETRVLARVREQKEKSHLWMFWLWRCIPAFCLLAILTAGGAATIASQEIHSLYSLTAQYDEESQVSILGE